MKDQFVESTAITATELIVQQVITAWEGQNKAVSKFINKYDEPAYLKEVAPGRNRAIYLLGHLVSTSDSLLVFFGLGDRLFPELEEIFSRNPDKTFAEIPSFAELKEKWEALNLTLTQHFSQMKTQEWLERHTKVSPEDFAKEPHRNKLNVLISRTNHQAYHLGQMNLLKGE
jgi:uncharacterized damage-inducible protein DinB